ncbi:MAG: RibD family protein [Leptospiraceae bacterium]|nr:RibD family protein [Leptospiraceae bacterium]
MQPHLSVNMAMTLDGKVMLPDGTWHGLTSTRDRLRMDEYRRQARILIVGRNSVEKDNPVFRLKDGGAGPRPTMICRSRLPVEGLRFFDHNPLLFIPPALEKQASQLTSCEVVIREDVSPRAVLEELGRRGYETALLEGGPSLNYDFFLQDLVDRLYLTVVPFVLGDSALPGILDGKRCLPDFKERRWKLHHCEKIENEIFTEYHRLRD